MGLEEAPPDVVHMAKRCAIDTLGVMLVGSRHHAVDKVRKQAERIFAAGHSTVFGGASLSAPGAALVNGMAAHVFDFDDTSYTGIMHGSAVVFPAALAAAQHAGGNGKLFLEAFLVGSEVTYALAMALGTDHYFKGWWSTATFGIVGAAAAAARALGLDQEQTLSAVAIAAVQASGMKALFGTDAKSLGCGKAARDGVEAASMAACGINGPESAFEDDRGYYALLGGGSVDGAQIERLGEVWRLVEPGIMFKRYPVCSAAHAATELTCTLVERHGLSSDDVGRVVCRVPRLVRISLIYDSPQTPQQAQFSLPFSVGCALAHGDITPMHISPVTLREPGLTQEMAKIVVEEDPSLAEGDLARRYPECAVVRLELNDGRVFEDFLGEPEGMPGNPMSDEALEDKFRACAGSAGLSSASIEKILETFWTIESYDDVSRLFDESGI
ncbi:MAG: MmgE/PrpD family protein [Proteobacteria bacterium]|nr:MmgE/PrpD family protein [Pseudomonadota bacterium]